MSIDVPPRLSNAWAHTPARLRAVIISVAVALVVLFAVPALWPHDAPRGQILLGAELGAVNGLLALGLVLTYRASRVINFSYGAMGALAATVAVELNLAHHVNWFVCLFLALVVGRRSGPLRRLHHPLALLQRTAPDRHGGDHRPGPALRGDPDPGAGVVQRTVDRGHGDHAAQRAPPADLPRPLQRQRPADRHRRARGPRCARLVPAAHRRRHRRAVGGRQLGPGPPARHSGQAAVDPGVDHRRGDRRARRRH